MISDHLSRALDYPYPAPRPPWILANHDIIDSRNPGFADAVRGLQDEPRHAIVAAGSNRAPGQLRRKFDRSEVVPVSMVTLHDVDTVYSAHFSAYGAIPATLIAAPGQLLRSAVLWLTDRQMARMNETEALGTNYRLGWLDRSVRSARFGLKSERTGAYVSLHGAMTDQAGEVVPLAGFSATGRRRPGRRQSEVQSMVIARMSPGSTLEEFINGTIEDAAERSRRRDHLKLSAIVPDETFWP